MQDHLDYCRELLKQQAEEKAQEQPVPEYKGVLATPIAELDISVRATNVCFANGIRTLGDLVKLTKEDFVRYRNGGKRTLAELSDLLEAKGLQWGMQVEDDRKQTNE